MPSHGRIQTGGTGVHGARVLSKPMAVRGSQIGSVLLALPVRFQNALKHARNSTKLHV